MDTRQRSRFVTSNLSAVQTKRTHPDESTEHGVCMRDSGITCTCANSSRVTHGHLLSCCTYAGERSATSRVLST